MISTCFFKFSTFGCQSWRCGVDIEKMGHRCNEKCFIVFGRVERLSSLEGIDGDGSWTDGEHRSFES